MPGKRRIQAANGARTISVRRTTRAVGAPPKGFRYLPEFITAAEEQRLLAALDALPFERVVMRGFQAKRAVVHYGVRYRFDGGRFAPAPPLPDFLVTLAARAIEEARFPDDAAIEALITRYLSGAGIGWHRDAPPFGPSLAGLSLLNPCEFRLRLASPNGYDLYRLRLAPRSLYVIAGSARFRWQHMIPPVLQLRYSVTFRTVRE